MKNEILLVCSLVLLHSLFPAPLYAQPNISSPKNFYIAKEVIPPVLNIDAGSVFFSDEGENNAIDANEKCYIRFQVKNSGAGDAMGCYARITAIGTTDGINYLDHKLGIIPSGQTVPVTIPIESGLGTKNGKVDFSIQIEEAQGFGTEAIQLAINTRQFEPPMLMVVDYSISGTSSSAKIEKRIPFDLQVLLQNTRYGKAENVNIKVTVPSGVTLLDDNLRSISFNEVNGGETKSIEYPLIAMVNYDKETIPVVVDVMEKYGKYAESRTITLSLNQNFTNTKIVVDEQKEERKEIAIGYLHSSVDKEIPVSRYINDKTFAVIVANENYQNASSVPYAINDGSVFKEYCEKALGIPARNIHYVPNATLNNIQGEVNWLENVLKSYEGQAKAIFYYAGHGVPDESSKDSYLLPVDGIGSNVKTGYKLQTLYASLGSLPSRSITVFIDACFSGANRDGEMLVPSLRGVVIKAKEADPTGNMVVFSAAQGNETAMPLISESHGLFTYYLLKKLQETGGDVSYQELSDYISQNVRQQSSILGKMQSPTVIPSSIVGENWKSWNISR
ncbi:MAG: caspase family protein [Bacteroidales bacterium]|nr:caspase family protein [Candidatus Cryptobacteroides aphodequi]